MIAVLVRAYLRRSRWSLLVFVLALGGLPALMAVSTRIGYPTQADIAAFARESMANLSELALRGPIFAETTGALVAWTLASSGSLVGGVVALIFIVRYARSDEQSGRVEMLLGARITRTQQVIAAMATVALAGAGVGVVSAATLLAVGMPAAGSVLLSLVLCCSILFFTGVGATLAQVATSPRTAGILSAVVLGVLFLLAAIGDATGSPIVWLSPFGWARHAEAFVGDRWWAPLIALVCAAALGYLTVRLNRGRDYTTGLIAARPGRAHAAAWIRGPLTLAIRLNRGTVVAWAAALTFLGAMMGSVMPTLDAQLAGTAFADFAARHGGGSVGEVFFQFVLYVLAQVATAAALAVVLELRTDETNGLAEAVLSRRVTRTRWAISRWVVAVGVGLVILMFLGLGASASGTLQLGSTLAYLPTVLVIVGLALALVGWLPRAAVAASWTVLGLLLFLDLLSEFALLPAAIVTRLSPFAATFTGLLMGGLPLVSLVLTVIGLALAGVGLAGLRRRDLAC